MKHTIAIIEWKDASTWGERCRPREEAEKLGLFHGTACGILVHEDKDQITLALDWFEEFDDFRNIAVYPKSGIKKIKRMKI